MRPPNQTTALIYRAIRKSLKMGYSPSLRELGKMCNMHHTSLLRHLDKLEARGYITREIYQSRSVRLGDVTPPAAWTEGEKG